MSAGPLLPWKIMSMPRSPSSSISATMNSRVSSKSPSFIWKSEQPYSFKGNPETPERLTNFLKIGLCSLEMELYICGEIIDRVAPVSAIKVSWTPFISPLTYIPSLGRSLLCILGSSPCGRSILLTSLFPKTTFKSLACFSVLFKIFPSFCLGSFNRDVCLSVWPFIAWTARWSLEPVPISLTRYLSFQFVLISCLGHCSSTWVWTVV